MKLVHPDLENKIVFEENNINIVTIENKPFFSSLIQELRQQCLGGEGNFVLSDNDKELDITKAGMLIIDPFSIDINSKNIVSKIFSKLKTLTVDEEYYLETNKLKTALYSYLDSLLFDCDIPLTYQDDFDFSVLFKMMNVQVEYSGNTMLDKLIDYVSITAELLNIKLFFFVNLKQFLSYEELAALYRFISYTKIDAVLFEGSFIENKHECEKHYIIDNDLCEIY